MKNNNFFRYIVSCVLAFTIFFENIAFAMSNIISSEDSQNNKSQKDNKEAEELRLLFSKSNLSEKSVDKIIALTTIVEGIFDDYESRGFLRYQVLEDYLNEKGVKNIKLERDSKEFRIITAFLDSNVRDAAKSGDVKKYIDLLVEKKVLIGSNEIKKILSLKNFKGDQRSDGKEDDNSNIGVVVAVVLAPVAVVMTVVTVVTLYAYLQAKTHVTVEGDGDKPEDKFSLEFKLGSILKNKAFTNRALNKYMEENVDPIVDGLINNLSITEKNKINRADLRNKILEIVCNQNLI
ncbi:MAG: hypothetical protein L6420_06120 [Elusimicrobia bacterium]|nr:hypothetical protein [Elusimicrobiota bacterium]